MRSEVTSPGLVRKVWRLATSSDRRKWIAVAAGGIVIAAIEAISAILLFVLIQMIDGSEVEIPDVFRFVGMDSETLDDRRGVFLLVVGGFFVVRSIAVLAQRYMQARVENTIGQHVAVRTLTAYLDMPYESHLARNSAELVRTAFWSSNALVVRVLTPATTLVSEAMVVLALVGVLLVVSPVGVVVTLAVIVVTLGLVLTLIHPRLKALGKVAEDSTEESLRALNQPLEGVREVKVLGREKYFARKFARARSRYTRASYLSATLSEVPRVALETAVFLLIIALLGLVFDGGEPDTSSVAVFALFGYAAVRLLPSVNRMASALNRIRYGAAAVDNIYADLAGGSIGARGVSRQTPASAIPPFRDSLEFKNVTFHYQGSDTPALRNVNLRIERGQSVGIVGPTGSGKSTLMDLLIGLIEPTEGAVLVDGRDLHEAGNLESWWRQLGLVPQSIFLLDDTLRRNVALGLSDSEIDDQRVMTACEAAQLSEFVERLPEGYDSMVGERGVLVSGGQRQRIAIARALYHEPQVLLFDEGTAALDTLTEKAVIRALAALRGQYTMVSIAHRLASVQDSDLVVLLVDGEVLDSGTYSDLRQRNPLFDRMAG